MAKITDSCHNHELNRCISKPSSQGFQSTALGHQKALQPGLIADVLLNTTHMLPTTREVRDKVILSESLCLTALHTPARIQSHAGLSKLQSHIVLPLKCASHLPQLWLVLSHFFVNRCLSVSLVIICTSR